MANYFIIGGDGKEYGPVSETDIRQWITEGRLNGQSSARRDLDAGWSPLQQFVEFADLLGAPPTIAPLSSASPANLAERDYELDIGGCVTRAWNLVKDNFGPLALGFLVAVAVMIAALGTANGLGLLLLPEVVEKSAVGREAFNLFYTTPVTAAVSPLIAGLYLMLLRTARRQPTDVSQLFDGFKTQFKDIFFGYLLMGLAVGLLMVPYNIISGEKLLPLVEQMKSASPTEIANLEMQLLSAFAGSLPLLLICMVPVTYLSVSLQFTLPLIVDKRLNFSDAITLGWKMVHKHWWQVFGMTIVAGLVSAAGVLLCCVGIIFTIPVGMAAMMFAYETIFGERQN